MKIAKYKGKLPQEISQDRFGDSGGGGKKHERKIQEEKKPTISLAPSFLNLVPGYNLALQIAQVSSAWKCDTVAKWF